MSKRVGIWLSFQRMTHRLIHSLELEMEEAAEDLRFERHAYDEIRELRRDLRDAMN